MDSYNIFGDDGSVMLEGLSDIGTTDGFTTNTASPVTDNKDTTDSSNYRSTYPTSVAQENIQKLPSFGPGAPQAIPTNVPPTPEYHEYGAYPPRPRLAQPHGSLHPSHHGHPGHSYPGYHPGPEPMYGISDHPNVNEMGWTGSQGPRYTSMTPGYRHSYEHQQKMHQYPQQASSLANLQSQNGSYMPRQPHYAQPPVQNIYGQQQAYGSYGQMHPPPASRIGQHSTYHQQAEVNPHQYGVGHTQAISHSSMPLQGVHLHHANVLHHVPRQPTAYHYQPHQMQHPVDVTGPAQYAPPPQKPTILETSSTQYRPQFQQNSPQASPRAQISPRQPVPQQLSPRPVMSPVKGTSLSPHSGRIIQQQPTPSVAPQQQSYSAQNTIQALEQMVLPPTSEFAQYKPANVASPAVPNLGSSPWNQSKPPIMSNVLQIETNDPMIPIQDQPKINMEIDKETIQMPSTVPEPKTLEKNVNTEKFMQMPSKVNTANPQHTNFTNTSFDTSRKGIDNESTNSTSQVVQNAPDVNINNDPNFVNKQSDLNILENNTKGIIPVTTSQQVMITNHHSITSASNIVANPPIPSNESNLRNFDTVVHSSADTNYSIPSNVIASGHIINQTMNVMSTGHLNNISANHTIQQVIVSTSQNSPSTQTLSQSNNPIVPLQTSPSQSGPINTTNIQLINSQQPMVNTTPININQNVIPNIPPNPPISIPPVPHPITPVMTNVHNPVQNNPSNVMSNIPSNMVMNISNPPVCGIFPPHHQEKSSLQQQIQDIYCLPPSSENQEKLRQLQDRLAFVQQHEVNDKCNGGPNCILQNGGYNQKMVESPQVSSTTGRGRGKGPPKPRKPRAKKEKPGTSLVPSSIEQLPLSEDCVTAGNGLKVSAQLDLNEELTNPDAVLSMEQASPGEKTKKRRGPNKNKPRSPRTPKADKGDKPVKERKKREPKDPNAPKKRKYTRREPQEIHADTTTTNDSSFVKAENSSLQLPNPNVSDQTLIGDGTVTDFDDIPVSKIAVKDLLEEAEAKRESMKDDDDFNDSKRRNKRRSKPILRKTPLVKRKRRSGVVLDDSDGEPDDMVSTPPPSPPQEDDSSKRRSARNTQRKKYTDDVMLRLSDDEFPLAVTSKKDGESSVSERISMDVTLKESLEGKPKPNYMYVNTTDDDAMIVQYILASRMGKRELKNENVQTEIKQSDECPLETDKTVDKISSDDQNEIHDKIKTDEENKTETTEIILETQNIAETKNVDDQKPVIVDVEEFYVKYRNFSHLHCEWKTEEELYKGDKRIFSKIKRFKQKQAQQNIFEMLDDEPFNPDYVEVERVLDVSENIDPANGTVVKYFLVKWKSMQYEDSTWELEEDVDVDKIKQFKIFNELPSKENWKYKKRPNADSWSQLNESPLYKGGNTLRPYQLEGLNWLLFSWHNNRNCILADEMGLGKTIQSLTFVNSVWEYGIRGPFLIIAPLSTVPNWQREFESWTDMNVIVYHGSQQSKSMIQEYEFFYKNENSEPIKDLTKFNVLITTFEIIVTDFQELRSFNWRICVIDEAHRLKNRNCKLLEGLRQLNLEHRVLLSGTPLQNNVNELFSLLNFLEPSQFSSNDAFLNEFGQLKTESEVLKLQALLKPMMLRRLKEDVEKTLGPKEETIIEVELTNIQKKYYRAILERNFSFLQKGTASAANIPNLMNTMMELRKCCIHPYLLNGAEDQIQFDYKQTHGEDKEAYYKALIQSSGKMVLVDKLLPKLKAGGHRVLIFSQMVRCLDILEDYLMFRKYPYERIDGRIRGNLRQEAIDRFSKPDSDRFVFLLCTKAGGLGINLTAADTVIIYDSDWNPQNDLQAQARCHRIGQLKMVKIYRLVCRNSYEREMFDKASLKLGLDKAVLQSMNTSQGKETNVRQMSKKEIEDLLKKGAYGAVMDEDNAGDKFCEEDIEMILARRTLVIQMESEKGSTFSKASFAATDQRSDIDIRDPDFWNKWAKKAEIDTTERKEDEDLIVTEPRKRTSIKRYGHDDGAMEMSDVEGTPESDEDEDGISLRSKKKKDKLGRKGRRYASDDYIPRHEGIPDEDVVYGSWTRSECFKIERGLLTFGWGRWDDVVDINQLRQGWTSLVIEDCARIIVLYCLRHYKGDEKIRNFIWDLIEPCENGEVTIARNHSGLHNPVPRGRNAKKKNRPKEVTPKAGDIMRWDDPNHWSSAEKYDCEIYLENSYKKHLFRHANKVLLRVRMMYYIKHEVIGDYVTQIERGDHASSLGMRVPRGVDSAPPRVWWDVDCDVSLLVGTYVHGYENYLAMRSDPKLCYVDKLGPPDDDECTDIKSEERQTLAREDECTDEVSSGAGAASPGSPQHETSHPWPSMQDLNTRLRRLITAYQRNYKREELKLQQRAKAERRERMEAYLRSDANACQWSRADEEAFRRTVASYGVEFDPGTKSLRWQRFRALAQLESKSDDALTDYLKAFMAMCKRQCGLAVGEAELPSRADLKAEPIGEERAIATLERIDLLRVLREEVAPHPALEQRLQLCDHSPDAPQWWKPAVHDKHLVLGVCKHGLGDTYNRIFCDPKSPFTDCAIKWYSSHKSERKVEMLKSDEEEEDKSAEESTSGLRMSLRRSKRNSNIGDKDPSEDSLLELETLAKLGRSEALSQSLWFTERALETRLHHIAHAVQNCEWPNNEPQKGETRLKPEPRERKPEKRHIAIDVETERAKLHALLSSPRPATASPRGATASPREENAPPPAHQRPPAAVTPLDLSAPLDLSDSLKDLKRTKPTPEVKEKKRRKLDEIVLGLSAAKRQASPAASMPSPKTKSSPVLANVSLTPVVPPSSSPALSSQKPFSVTVTTVPSPQSSSSRDIPSFLQHSLEHSPAAKTTKSTSSTMPSSTKQYSHDAKVNKWLSEQVNVDSRRRTSVNTRLTPDEHVPVVHRVTGKRIVGNKSPQLKHLAQWITDNPMYDIDPKWTENIKEHVKLSQDVRSQRVSPMQTSAGVSERKKGRPPSIDSTSANVLSSTAHINQSLAGLNPGLLASLSAFDPKTLASTLSSLSAFDPKLLSSFDPKLLSNLGGFDPKNNPLLNFGSIPNLLSGNLFANLSNLGLPGFSSLDMAGLGASNNSAMDPKAKSSRKSSDNSSTSTKQGSQNSQFPFVFPNPNMLYPQLGLGGMNPFGMHSGLTSAYDALGLLNTNMTTSTASSAMGSHNTSRSSKTTSSSKPATVTTATTSRHSKPYHYGNQLLSQINLPPETQLMETKHNMNLDLLLKSEKKSRESEEATDLSRAEKKRTGDSSRSQIPPEFAAVQEKLLKGDKKDIDISKMLLEQMASGALSASIVSSAEGKRADGVDKIELYDKKIANPQDYYNVSGAPKKKVIEMTNEPENLSVGYNDSHVNNKPKDNQSSTENKSPATHGEMDLEDLIAPSTVIKTGINKPTEFENRKQTKNAEQESEMQSSIEKKNDQAEGVGDLSTSNSSKVD